MALINFDCPECGHNLEVDEGGAGFIVKCPECGNPLQIPDLPPSRRRRKALVAASTLLAILLLFAANVVLGLRTRRLNAELADLQQAYGQTVKQAQVLALDQQAQIQALNAQLSQIEPVDAGKLAQTAREALSQAEALSQELEQTSRRFIENDVGERTAVLRRYMAKLFAAAKTSLPAAPQIADAAPGRGIGGRQIAFPVLPGPDGQILRQNAEVTGVEGDKVFFRFAGGTASYSLSELHPGVAAYLPVDPLLALPRGKWTEEVRRVHQMECAQRDELLARLRADLEAQLPPAKP